MIKVGEMSGIHYSTTCEIVKQVSFVLARVYPQFVAMPKERKMYRKINVDFMKKQNFLIVLEHWAAHI